MSQHHHYDDVRYKVRQLGICQVYCDPPNHWCYYWKCYGLTSKRFGVSDSSHMSDYQQLLPPQRYFGQLPCWNIVELGYVQHQWRRPVDRHILLQRQHLHSDVSHWRCTGQLDYGWLGWQRLARRLLRYLQLSYWQEKVWRYSSSSSWSIDSSPIPCIMLSTNPNSYTQYNIAWNFVLLYFDLVMPNDDQYIRQNIQNIYGKNARMELYIRVRFAILT